MPLRLPCKAVQPVAGSVLAPYWGPAGLYRPVADVYAVCPARRVHRVVAQLDSAADHIVLASDVAVNLGLPLPFPRQMGLSGAAGSYAMTLSFPPDGLVCLFVTDYRE